MDKHHFKKKFSANLKNALEYLGIAERNRAAAVRDALKKALGSRPTDQAVRQWFEGDTTPSNYNLVALCDQLGLSVAYLLTGRGPILSGSEAVDINGNVAKISVRDVPVLSEREVKEYISAKRVADFSRNRKVTITHHSGPDTFATEMPDNSMAPLFQKGVILAIDPDYPGLGDLPNCDKPIAVIDNESFMIGRYKNDMLMFDNERFEPHKLSETANIFGCVIRVTEVQI